MTSPASEISKRATRLLTRQRLRSSRSDEQWTAQANGVLVVVGLDGSMHVHLTNNRGEVGPTIYAELSGGYVTTWDHLEVKVATARLAAVQVLDDLSSV